MQAPLAMQHEWLTAVLRGHYGYWGRPQLSGSQRLLPGAASDLAELSETA